MMKQKQAVTEFVRQYEGKMFKGPNSIIFDSSGTMYFTDSGPIGETTIQKPLGSVFCITDEGDEGSTLLQPLAYECLAHPCGLALSPDEDVLYVAETMKNRILRFVQKPMGVYHMSVFHQFSGGFGPSALVCDKKFLYVAHFDFAGNVFVYPNFANECLEFSSSGKISILRPDGALHGVIKVEGPEITGLCFDT
jgi:sugar lactone lactonase YvrE